MPHTVTPIRHSSNMSLPDHVVAFEVSKRELLVQAVPADGQHTIGNAPAAARRILGDQAQQAPWARPHARRVRGDRRL
jgi:hypothetical protein